MLNLSLQILANADSNFLKYAADSDTPNYEEEAKVVENLERSWKSNERQKEHLRKKILLHSPAVMSKRTTKLSPDDYNHSLIANTIDMDQDDKDTLFLGIDNYYNNTKPISVSLAETLGPMLLSKLGLLAPSNAEYNQNLMFKRKPYVGIQSDPNDLSEYYKYKNRLSHN